MNRTFLALVVKFIMTFLAAWVAFGLFYDNEATEGNTFLWLLIVALLGTAVNYLIGDLLVFPNFGNLVAAIGDGLIAAILAYLVDLLTDAFNTTFLSLVIFAVIIFVFELIFHRYLANDDKVAP